MSPVPPITTIFISSLSLVGRASAKTGQQRSV
jgi:hypothetical protein